MTYAITAGHARVFVDEAGTVCSWGHYCTLFPWIQRLRVCIYLLTFGLSAQNCHASKNSSWVGHVSYFWEGRGKRRCEAARISVEPYPPSCVERLSATKTNAYSAVIGYTRSFHRNSSPFSKFNSTMVAMSS